MARLLDTFRGLFEGKVYNHRNSTQGDEVAQHLFEDLLELDHTSKFCSRVKARTRVINTRNRATGKKSRRGDGTFGELIPATDAIAVAGFSVGRGPIATIEIGVETKILAKAMIKQIDRVCSDLERQAAEFRRVTPQVITVALVGVNHADMYTSYERDRQYTTDGSSKSRHPNQEAGKAMQHLAGTLTLPHYDHSLILSFAATNQLPYPFNWVNAENTELEYSAMLVRILRHYDHAFH